MSPHRILLGIGLLTCIAAIGCGASDSATSDRGRGGSAGGSGFSNPSTSLGNANGPNGNPVVSPTGTVGTASGGNGQVCASAVVQTSKNDPTIVFVIDGSGSMCAPFGGSTRWTSLRTALLDPMKGLIYRLQSSVSFGATLYDGTIDITLALLGGGGGMGNSAQNPSCSLQSAMGKDMGQCPQLIESPPAKNNAQAIDMIFPQKELGGSTPTDKALSHVMDGLIASRMPQGPDDKKQQPVYVILATDGAPNDICVNGAGGDGSAQRAGVIAAVDRGAAAGITTWVISLADDPSLQMHLDEVARHGDPANAMAHTFSPMNPDDLIMTLAQLLGGAIGCNIALNGQVTMGQECLGKVTQNSAVLPCCQTTAPGAFSCNRMPTTTPSGWRLTDPRSIELLGDACTNFLIGSGNLISATFPCEVFQPD